MKLNELAVANPTKQIAKVFESHFGKPISFDTLTSAQADQMLQRVRSLVREHRRTPAFHTSEQNPAYLKLVMLEQALTKRVNEVAPVVPGAAMAATAGGGAEANPAAVAMQMTARKKQIQDQIKQKQNEIRDLQQQLSRPMGESRASLRRRLQESEVQQAQVVLASQDMVDQVQKMLEQVSAMQFKDLPALVDQVKNQVGVDQAMQFNTDASAALTGMIQNLQASKAQLEQALGVVTGQAPVVPGADMGVGAEPDLGGEMPAELPAPGEEEITDTDIEIEEPEAEPAASTLGRGRR